MDDARRAEALVSTVIAGRFRLRRLLGAGGMGAVYEAIDEWTERRVALKRLRREDSDDRAEERFFREARAVARLDHPHIVRLFDLGRDGDGSLFLVQELLEGQDLRRLLRDRTALTERETLELLFAATDAVAHAHALGVVHRDLKPENIFVQRAPSGRIVPRLIDFGIARGPSRDGQLTPDGQVFGTPSYMAPEQADGHHAVAPAWDLWALGVIAFECLTGRNPYARDNVLATLSAVLKDRAPAIAAERQGLSPALCAVIDRALERDPARRFSDAFAMRDALFATGLLDGDPWAKTLLDRPADDGDRRSLERLANDGAMATAPLVERDVEPTLAPAPAATSARVSSAAAPSQGRDRTDSTGRTDTIDPSNAAVAIDRERDSEPEMLDALGLRPRPARRRSAFVVTVLGAAIALTLFVTRGRDDRAAAGTASARAPAPSDSAPTTAPRADTAALPSSSATTAPASIRPAPAAVVRAQRAPSPRVVQAPEARARAESEAAEPVVPAANAAPIVHTERPSERAPAAAPPTTPADDETSTPIRRYP